MCNLRHYFAIKHTKNGRQYPFLDCWGLVCEYYKLEKNITLYPYSELSQDTMSQGFECEKTRFKEISANEVKNGDVVAFFKDMCLYHVGIYYNDKILQTTSKHNVTLQKIPSSNNIRYFRYGN